MVKRKEFDLGKLLKERICSQSKFFTSRVASENEDKLSRFRVVSLFGISRPGCSKLMTSLVNDSLKFQTLISQIGQYFLLKKCEKLLSFFLQKISVYLVIKCKTLKELTS